MAARSWAPCLQASNRYSFTSLAVQWGGKLLGAPSPWAGEPRGEAAGLLGDPARPVSLVGGGASDAWHVKGSPYGLQVLLCFCRLSGSLHAMSGSMVPGCHGPMQGLPDRDVISNTKSQQCKPFLLVTCNTTHTNTLTTAHASKLMGRRLAGFLCEGRSAIEKKK